MITKLQETIALARAAGQEYDRPVSLMFVQIMWLRVRYGQMLRGIRLGGLLDPDPGPFRIARQVSARRLQKWLLKMNPPALRGMVDLKPHLYARCRELGVRVPEIYAIGRPDAVLLAGLPARFFVKPVNGAGGYGISAFTRRGNGFLSWDEKVYSAEEVLLVLEGLTNGRDLIFQEWMQVHPALANLSGEALPTVRLITRLRGKQPPVPEILSCYLKVPGLNRIVDNLGYSEEGQQSIELEPRSGQPVAVWKVPPSGFGVYGSRKAGHGKGIPLEQIWIPDWPAAVNMVETLTVSFPELGSVGWDIGLSDDGPVVIEGNTAWGATMYPSGLEMIARFMRESSRPKAGLST